MNKTHVENEKNSINFTEEKRTPSRYYTERGLFCYIRNSSNSYMRFERKGNYENITKIQ